MGWNIEYRDDNYDLYPISTPVVGSIISSAPPETSLSLTFNYAGIYYDVMQTDNGLRSLDNMSGAEALPILRDAIDKLDDDLSENYWEPTEGNARRGLEQLAHFAEQGPGHFHIF